MSDATGAEVSRAACRAHGAPAARLLPLELPLTPAGRLPNPWPPQGCSYGPGRIALFPLRPSLPRPLARDGGAPRRRLRLPPRHEAGGSADAPARARPDGTRLLRRGRL